MRVLGNILWIILGGLAIAIGWALVGLILCISIIGVPLGIQAFKMAGLTLTPFGKTVQYGGGVGSTLANILWVVLVGWWMALGTTHRILPRTRMICPFPISVDASHIQLHYFARHHDGNTRRNPWLAPDSSSDRYSGGSYAVSPILLRRFCVLSGIRGFHRRFE